MLKKVWSGWLKFGHWLGDHVARLFLVVFYFTLALPFGLLVRLAQDPLDIRNKVGAGWIKRQTNDGALQDAERSF